MAAASMLSCKLNIIHARRSTLFGGVGRRIPANRYQLCQRIRVVASTEGSADSSKSAEKIPAWAKPDAVEPPPWARDDGSSNSVQQTIGIPYPVYLLGSTITAIAAIGSVFEYANQNPVFGIIKPDSIFYAPLLGFFVFTGLPASAFLWFKSVQVANKEAEEQDRRDGYF